MKVILVATHLDYEQKRIYDILCSHNVFGIRTYPKRGGLNYANIVGQFFSYAQLAEVMSSIKDSCLYGCYIKKIIEPRRPLRLRLARLFRRKK